RLTNLVARSRGVTRATANALPAWTIFAHSARDLLDDGLMSSLRIAVLALPLAACIGNVQRAARVPHPSVPLESGQALTTPADITAGLANVTDIVKPRVGDATQAVEVPSTEARGEARLRIHDRGWISAIYEHGFGATSKQPDPTQAPVGKGDVEGFGLGFGYSFKTS